MGLFIRSSFLVMGVALACAACGSSDSSSSSSGGAAGTDGGGAGGTSGSGGTAGASGSGGTAGASGSGGTAGASGSGGTAGASGSGGSGGSGAAGSVLEFHNSPRRDGLYIDAAITKSAAPNTHMDTTFSATLNGPTYSQPLYFTDGPGGKEIVIVATEQNDVTAFDAANGSVVWTKNLGAPVPRNKLPCGNIDPLGTTGAGVIDVASRTLFLDAMTTPDAGTTKKHMIFALSLDDGSVKTGWPVDVSAKVTDGSHSFDSSVQNERGGLTIMNGVVYVPYGGHYGDCGTYYGWVVGVPMNDPASPKGWSTRARGGGAWAPTGVSSDGTSVFVATGNTFGANTWSDGEGVIKLGPGPTYSAQTKDYFSPSNWKSLDSGDVDIGSSGAMVLDVPGATPSKLLVAMGKNGVAYLIDRDNLGGVGTGNGTTGEGVASAKVANNQLIQSEVTYSTSQGTYVVFRGSVVGCPSGNGDLGALKISATAPPTMSVAWCATQSGRGSPIVTTTDGHAGAMVWALGAEGNNRLMAFDGDTGATIFDGSGAGNAMTGLRRYMTPIAAKGRIFVAGDSKLYAFTMQ